MYLTYYVHKVGIKRRDWLQECTELKASKHHYQSASALTGALSYKGVGKSVLGSFYWPQESWKFSEDKLGSEVQAVGSIETYSFKIVLDLLGHLQAM